MGILPVAVRRTTLHRSLTDGDEPEEAAIESTATPSRRVSAVPPLGLHRRWLLRGPIATHVLLGLVEVDLQPVEEGAPAAGMRRHGDRLADFVVGCTKLLRGLRIGRAVIHAGNLGSDGKR